MAGKKFEPLFDRGDPIVFDGKDSYFEGFFVAYIWKLPWREGETEGVVRCVVQQKDTGILLIKGEPTEKNRPKP